MPVTVRPAVKTDRVQWLQMRDALWPGSLSDHERETQLYFEGPDPNLLTLVAEEGGQLLGFLELGQRSYAEACESSPVAFIEGWYVAPNARAQGVGRALVAAAEAHSRAAGHTEIASDAELENQNGIAAHLALGYEETDRVVCFRKALRKG